MAIQAVGNSGSFQGGSTLKKLLEEMKKKAANTTLRVGVLEGATNSAGESIPEYATRNEYGDGVLPRPAMRNTSKAKGKSWSKDVARLVKANNYDFAGALTIVGDIASKDIQESIQTYPKDPPNSPSTIAKKKAEGYNPYDQPLVHTGDYLRSISFEVEEK